MADVPQVTILAGIPVAGDGTVDTLIVTNARIGEVQSSPTANTLLDRVKTTNTNLIAIEALLPDFGSAGSASTEVVTIQGIASMTPIVISDGAGSITIDTSVTGGAAGVLGVGGTVATNVAITANPVNLGAQAVAAENAAVTATRQVQLVADLAGKLIVLPYANPENFVSGTITTSMTATASTLLVAAPASGLRNYLTQITVSNAHPTVGTDVVIQDGSGGAAMWTIPAAAVYGGAVITFPTPLRQPTTATAIYCANVTTGASTKVSGCGYKGA